MSKKVLILLSMVFLSHLLFAKTEEVYMITVFNEQNQALSGATLVDLKSGKGIVSNERGQFIFDNRMKGKHQFLISFIGYQLDSLSLYFPLTHNHQVILKSEAITIGEVVVKNHYALRHKKESSLSVEQVDEAFLKENLGGNIVKSLEKIPGVSSIDIGSGGAKPLIRGLGFNRVVVVENNVKHEAQQWGADHGLEIDQYAIDHVELIKGAASLMYGSDAIGGVIDMSNKSLPLPNSYGANLDLTAKSNNNLLGGSFKSFFRQSWFFAEIRLTTLNYADYKVPAKSVDIYSYKADLDQKKLRNTAGEEHNFHLSFGAVSNDFKTQFYISNVSSKGGFFANAHGLSPTHVDTKLHDESDRDVNFPYQSSRHTKLTNTSLFRFDDLKLHTNIGFQTNLRQEKNNYTAHGYKPSTPPIALFDDVDLEKEFDKDVYSGRVNVEYNYSKKTQLSIGLNSEIQKNKIGGVDFVIPEFDLWTMGSFLYYKYNFSSESIFQAGLRYDFTMLETKEYKDWFKSPTGGSSSRDYLVKSDEIDRDFSNYTWSLGYNYNPTNWYFKTNIAKSFRVPIAKELAANGVNYHYYRYEIGNSDLDPEISYQLDLGAEYSSKIFSVGFSPFINYFTNCIYLKPTPRYDITHGAGHQIFEYTQAKVLRYGAEIHALYNLNSNIEFGLDAEYLLSRIKSGASKDYSLPFSPPNSVAMNIKYGNLDFSVFEKSYIKLESKFYAKQEEVLPPEEITDSYKTFNLAMGTIVDVMGSKLRFSFQVNNLLDEKYFNHISFYRLINVPEPGRNFILNITIPIEGKF